MPIDLISCNCCNIIQLFFQVHCDWLDKRVRNSGIYVLYLETIGFHGSYNEMTDGDELKATHLRDYLHLEKEKPEESIEVE